MPEFTFDSHRVKFQKLRYTVSAKSETEARRLIAAGEVAGVADGPAVLIHAGELEPARPTWVATYDGAGCPVWTAPQHTGAASRIPFLPTYLVYGWCSAGD